MINDFQLDNIKFSIIDGNEKFLHIIEANEFEPQDFIEMESDVIAIFKKSNKEVTVLDVFKYKKYKEAFEMACEKYLNDLILVDIIG